MYNSSMLLRRISVIVMVGSLSTLGSVSGLQAQAAKDDAVLQLPRLSIADLQFEGAFRLPASTYGASSLNYSQGPLEYNPASHSIFIVGHSHHQAIAEFGVPPLVQSTNLAELNMAGAPTQVFTSILGGVSGGNTQNIDRVGGMELVTGPNGVELLVNAYEYYDAPGDNTHSTLVLRNPGRASGAVASFNNTSF